MNLSKWISPYVLAHVLADEGIMTLAKSLVAYRRTGDYEAFISVLQERHMERYAALFWKFLGELHDDTSMDDPRK